MSDMSLFNLGRIGADQVDNTQREILNTRYNNYSIANYFEDPASTAHVDFATSYPNLMFSSVNGGSGVGGAAVDAESMLFHSHNEHTRALERLQLITRPFATVPYLGRGSCDPAVESQLMQGESAHDKKSVSTIMTKSFMDYSMYPTDETMMKQNDEKHTIQEVALDGWVRGGMITRQMTNDQHYSQQSRPSGFM